MLIAVKTRKRAVSKTKARAQKTGAWLKKAWQTSPAEILATGGASAVTTGVAQIYGPAGWITGGLFGIAGAVCVAKSKGV
ncbi:hypothetical protein [Amycolatopsis sp. NPDC059657]|uniref:hypothetical protein n=1 Tax=Amycolatopsis sp. NPDC059657 TaxID=3346899 RepID=UPI0036717D7E